MSRNRKSIGELADSVLAQVAQEQLVKSAALAHISPVSVSTELGSLLVKVAAELKTEANAAQISYADIAQFRKKYDV